MNDFDLEDPKPKTNIDSVTREQRHWHLALSLAAFGVVYSFLHKVIIPLILGVLGTSRADYAALDWNIVYFVAFGLWLHKKQCLHVAGSIFTGLILSHALIESIDIVLNPQGKDWLSFSKVLSSWPMAITGVWMLGMKQRLAKTPHFALGLLVGLVALGSLQFFNPMFYQKQNPSLESTPFSQTDHSVLTPSNNELDACGSMRIFLDSSIGKLSSSELVRFSECGLSPSVFKLKSSQTLQIHNDTSSPRSAHLIIFSQNKRRNGWNILLQKNSSKEMPLLLKENEIGILVSDSWPEAGLAIFFNEVPQNNWHIQRQPFKALMVEPLSSSDSGRAGGSLPSGRAKDSLSFGRVGDSP